MKNVEESGDGFVCMFVNNIQAIFSHPRTDIVKACKNFSNEQLKILCSHLFNKIKTILPESDFSEGFDLYDRQKKKDLSEDIFIMGSCVVNEIEDVRLKRILKPNSVSANLINISISIDEQTPEPDCPELF